MILRQLPHRDPVPASYLLSVGHAAGAVVESASVDQRPNRRRSRRPLLPESHRRSWHVPPCRPFPAADESSLKEKTLMYEVRLYGRDEFGKSIHRDLGPTFFTFELALDAAEGAISNDIHGFRGGLTNYHIILHSAGR